MIQWLWVLQSCWGYKALACSWPLSEGDECWRRSLRSDVKQGLHAMVWCGGAPDHHRWWNSVSLFAQLPQFLLTSTTCQWCHGFVFLVLWLVNVDVGFPVCMQTSSIPIVTRSTWSRPGSRTHHCCANYVRTRLQTRRVKSNHRAWFHKG